MASTDRAIGKVKMIDQQKGFGFIRRDNEKDLFFHVTECLSKEQFSKMNVGDDVSYGVGEGKRGDEGRDVELVSAE